MLLQKLTVMGLQQYNGCFSDAMVEEPPPLPPSVGNAISKSGREYKSRSDYDIKIKRSLYSCPEYYTSLYRATRPPMTPMTPIVASTCLP